MQLLMHRYVAVEDYDSACNQNVLASMRLILLRYAIFPAESNHRRVEFRRCHPTCYFVNILGKACVEALVESLFNKIMSMKI